MDCSHRDLGRFEGVCGEADGGVMRDTLLVPGLSLWALGHAQHYHRPRADRDPGPNPRALCSRPLAVPGVDHGGRWIDPGRAR